MPELTRIDYTAPCPACGQDCTFTTTRSVNSDSKTSHVEVNCPCEETSH